jgi:hypothetical protein
MEEIDYRIRFRWFIGLSLDEAIWSPTVVRKHRDRLLPGDIARAFFAAVLDQARAGDLLSDEHFTVGTMLEAWASLKSFRRTDATPPPPPEDPGNPTVNFHGEPRNNDTHVSTTDPEAQLSRTGQRKAAQLAGSGTRAPRQSSWPGGECVRTENAFTSRFRRADRAQSPKPRAQSLTFSTPCSRPSNKSDQKT